MENRQTRGEVLVIRCVAGDQIRSGFNNGFVDVRGFDAVIELDMGAQLYLGNRNVIQSFCRPIQYAMDFVEIDALGGPVALLSPADSDSCGFYLSVKENIPRLSTEGRCD